MKIKFKQSTTLKEALDDITNIVGNKELDNIKNVINMEEIKSQIGKETTIDFEGFKKIFDDGENFIIEI